MSGNASRSTEDVADISTLEERLSRSRSVPEFTTQAVSSNTGVPPETLHSWERRYGFPKPARTESNRRLYTGQDIVSVAWLRQQSEQGQGISEAIAMLRRVRDISPTADPEPAPSPPSQRPSSRQPALTPVMTLTDALASGNLGGAQDAWDRLALATSPEALCSDVILPASSRIDRVVDDRVSRDRAMDFLLRKSIVLFDNATPDHGTRNAVLVTNGDVQGSIAAYTLGAILSRAGFRITLPILNSNDARTPFVLHAVERSMPIIVVSPDESTYMEYRPLLASQTLSWWWHEDLEGTVEARLPVPLQDVPGAL